MVANGRWHPRSTAVAAAFTLCVACSGPPPAPTPELTSASRSPAATFSTAQPPTPSAEAKSSVPGTRRASIPATALPNPSATFSRLHLEEADIERHLDALQAIADANAGTRAAGTAGYEASVDYVANELAPLGFQVTQPDVDFTFFNESEPVLLTVGDRAWLGKEWLHAMLYSASGSVTGEVQVVGQSTGVTACDSLAWQGFIAGRIAVVPPAPCTRRQQVELAQDHGAVAFVGVYPAWQQNQTRQPTLIDPAGLTIPVVAAGGEPATALMDPQNAQAEVRVQVQAEMSPTRVRNVIADVAGGSDEVVMLGAHLDSVLDGPGINDNGSGVATLLALAKSVASHPGSARGIRFGFWAAEEFGEVGSTAYVNGLSADERARIDAYINLDMAGSVGGQRQVYSEATAPAGSDEITDALMSALSQAGTPGTPTDLGGASDHAQFQRVGIRTGGVFSGLDACYHLACDTADNIDMTMLMDLATAVASTLESLAYATPGP